MVLLFPGGRGWVTAVVPALAGCTSQGRSREEALASVRRAMGAWMAVWRAKGETAPPQESLPVVLDGVREALEIQRELREDEGEDIETSLELRTVDIPLQAAA
ncbi:MAG: hypothetical protein HY690_13330 [Chloroflexi bacterium]|nr:hypothetical protein [Chloroflexota bacterium]